MEFIISKNEITRRKKAFATLLSSMIVGLLLGSFIFSYPISIYGYSLVIAAFFPLIIITFIFLNSISRLKIYISDEGIKKVNDKLSESFLFSDIKSIKVKRRTNGMIREIYIFFNNQKELIITAFEEDFEKIRNLLISKINSNILVKEIKEPINFDHPLFYSILGLPISFIGILFIKIVTTLDYFQTKYILLGLSVYVFIIGMYFIIKKPTSIRSGRKQTIIDYIIGLIIACGGIFIFFIGIC
jgi:hypothetical protein